MSFFSRSALCDFLAEVLLTAPLVIAWADPTVTTLSSISGTTANLVAGSAGNLYGTTYNGGVNGEGTVFKLSAENNYALTTLTTFSGDNGATPYAGLIADSAGNWYGTTYYGGADGEGTVFKLDASNNYAITTLATFNGANGKYPDAGLIADSSGNLYGTTAVGGANDYGTVFKLDAVPCLNFPELDLSFPNQLPVCYSRWVLWERWPHGSARQIRPSKQPFKPESFT